MNRKHILLVIFLALAAIGCSTESSESGEVILSPENDINVGFIKRLPEIDYVWNSDSPEREGWPAPGQEVTWQAHVINRDSKSYENVAYTWELDGEEILSGTVALPPNEVITLELPWQWEFKRHELRFQIDSNHDVPEFSEVNNELTIYTDAITIGLYVEQGFYDFFLENQHRLSIGSNSFEDYIQRSFQKLNELFETSVFSSAPQGVLDRIRIDDIHIVADGALPLDKSVLDDDSFDPVQAKPNIQDRTVDLIWGFPSSRKDDVFANRFNLTEKTPTNLFYIDGFVLHEVMHARYLIDNYATDIYHGTSNGWVNLKEDGELIAGSKYMDGGRINFGGVEGYILYDSKHDGLMTDISNFYLSEYTVLALNDIAGHRAVSGNYNAPENIGRFLNFLPDENILELRSESGGEVLANARVEIFQSAVTPPQFQSANNAVYAEYYDDEPDLTLETDEFGRVNVGKNPFSTDSEIIMTDSQNYSDSGGFSNATVILRVETDDHIGYTFLEVLDFNLQYFVGNTERASYEVMVPLVEKTGG